MHIFNLIDMGEMTSLTGASSKSDSLRATVPAGIVRQFHMESGDQLDWEIQVLDGKLAIVVTLKKSHHVRLINVSEKK